MSIYVLRSDNLIKIGFSDNLRQRVQSIISSVPVPVEFVGHMPGGIDLEAHLHERFAAHRFSGEWFVETDEMRAVFEAILTPRLPEQEKEDSRKKRADASVVNDVSERIRAAVASRWPLLSKGDRIVALAGELGWNVARVKDLYYRDQRVAVRAFELAEIEEWLGEAFGLRDRA